MNPWLIAAGAGLGLLKGKEDERKHQALMQAESAKTKYSPWTGMKGQITQGPSVLGSAMQGAMAGAMMGDGDKDGDKLGDNDGDGDGLASSERMAGEQDLMSRRNRLGTRNGMV